MSRTLVVNYHYEDYDVLITRGTPFGNNNPITFTRTRTQAIDLHFRDMARRLSVDPSFHHQIMALEGKRLGCVCRPMDCHGDFYTLYIDTCRAIERIQPNLSLEELVQAILARIRKTRK